MDTCDRSAVDEFFAYRIDEPPNQWWKKPLFAVAAALTIYAAWSAGELVVGTLLATELIGIQLLARNQLSASRRRREARLEQLARETRVIQAQDVQRAFLRAFRRTQLDPVALRTLQQVFILDQERELFEDVPTETLTRDLHNKSIRLISRDHFRSPRLRRITWRRPDGSHRRMVFFNPIRLVSIFLTAEELVICDVGIDSASQDRREEIERIMLTDITTICFNAERTRIDLPETVRKTLALDLGRKEKPLEFVEEKTSSVSIETRGGSKRQFPIKSDLLIGDDTPRDDELLTPDEIAIDRMVNELNRVVRSSRMNRTA